MTHRPDPTALDLLIAARALLARAEAMLSEQPTDAPPASKPEPIGTWGGHTDWIAWGGGECPVPDDALVQTVYRREKVQSYAAITQPACHWCWTYDNNTSTDIIAYRLATPAAPPVQEPEPKPAPMLLREWVRYRGSGWCLVDSAGGSVATIDIGGWTVRNASGPETGLLGKEKAVEHLTAAGARWQTDAHRQASINHCTLAVFDFDPGDVAVMADGSRRELKAGTGAYLLFTDGTWLTTRAAATAIAARIPAAAKT